MRSGTILLAALLCAMPGCADQPIPEAGPEGQFVKAGQGIMVGEVTDESALVQVRLTQSDQLQGAPGTVAFLLEATESNGSGSPAAQTVEVKATAERDFIARAHFSGLAPGTRYVCRSEIAWWNGKRGPGPEARFRTLPGAEQAEPVRFVVVTGMNYAKFHGDERIDRQQHVVENNTELAPPYTGADKQLGYPTLVTILKMQPDFFVGTGDNVYYDTPERGRAETAEQMRHKWHQQFAQPRYHDLFAAVPTYWEIDDHDYRIDDGDNSGDYLPSPELGKQIMLEQLPYAPADAEDPKTYRTHRVSRDLQIWLVENRLHRSPNSMPDGPGKSIWGAEQRAWLQETLAASDASFKLLISPTPMVGPDDLRKTDNHADIGGFRHERDEFFAWLKEEGLLERGFFVVCGDRHWQYHSIDPSGVEEFSCGALIDENSRLGRKPGDPKSTDAQGEVKQPYYQTPASGGFLLVEVTPQEGDKPAELHFKFHDETGELLYEEVKQ